MLNFSYEPLIIAILSWTTYDGNGNFKKTRRRRLPFCDKQSQWCILEIRQTLVCGYNFGIIDDIEFALLFDTNRSKNPDIPHWKYERFSLDNLTEDDCKTDFRFYPADIVELKDVFQLLEEILCSNNVRVDSIEALCILLKRYSYPLVYIQT